ncbi:hypothetical protein C0581_03030 [Candidatus Parcubacteria bacterium]|nr:MAG: hypothetical protein C0581_03030 [Candidatus Parcubacteria bacterium]
MGALGTRAGYQWGAAGAARSAAEHEMAEAVLVDENFADLLPPAGGVVGDLTCLRVSEDGSGRNDFQQLHHEAPFLWRILLQKYTKNKKKSSIDRRRVWWYNQVA